MDTSVTLAWVFEDECTEQIEALLDRVCDEGGLVPSLWQYEVCNALASATRQGRCNQAAATRILGLLADINLRVTEASVDKIRVYHLAHTTGLSAYDAAYIDLAMSKGLPLATLDQRLAQVAIGLGVEVLPTADK